MLNKAQRIARHAAAKGYGTGTAQTSKAPAEANNVGYKITDNRSRESVQRARP
jgi:hypothetical protein